MPYKATSFYFPTSGGSHDIELGVEPQALIFFGGNVAAEDAFVSGGNPGVFFGMAWRDQGSGAIDQQASTNIAFATGFQPRAIHQFLTGTTVDYEAVVTSFNPTGFTLSVTNPAGASRLIHVLALYEFDGCEGSTMASTSNAVYDFLNLGYRPFTSLAFHHWPSGADRDVAAANAYVFSMGVRNFPEDTDFDPNSAQAIFMRITTQLGAVGWTDAFRDFIGETITLTVRPGLVGSILQADDKAAPHPARDSEGIRFSLNGYPTRHSGLWWSGDGSAHDVSVPDLGQQSVVTARPYLDEVEAALFFGVMGYGDATGSNPAVLYTHGVLTEDYQGCVAFSTGLGKDMSGTPGFFQSKELCFVENIRSPGVRAASGEINGNQIILTGEIEDEPAPVKAGSYVNLYGPSVDEPSMYVMDV